MSLLYIILNFICILDLIAINKILLGFLLGFIWLSLGFNIMHDASHYAYFKSPRLNNLASAAWSNFALASHGMWFYHHVLYHHAFTNTKILICIAWFLCIESETTKSNGDSHNGFTHLWSISSQAITMVNVHYMLWAMSSASFFIRIWRFNEVIIPSPIHYASFSYSVYSTSAGSLLLLLLWYHATSSTTSTL